MFIVRLYLPEVRDEVLQDLSPGLKPVCKSFRWVSRGGHRAEECAVDLLAIVGALQRKTPHTASFHATATAAPLEAAAPAQGRLFLKRVAPRQGYGAARGIVAISGLQDLGPRGDGVGTLHGWTVDDGASPHTRIPLLGELGLSVRALQSVVLLLLGSGRMRIGQGVGDGLVVHHGLLRGVLRLRLVVGEVAAGAGVS